MPSHVKRWILVKGCEYNPDGIISLGQILVSPFDPSNPLLSNSLVPMSKIEYSCQHSVNVSSSNSLGGSFGIWADINLLPVSAEIGGGAKFGDYSSLNFERLEGQIAVPQLEDVSEILNGDDAIKHIRRSRFNFRKRLYIITGVRIARGATLNMKSSTSIAAHAKLGVDLTIFGGPANAGPNGSFSRAEEAVYSSQNASDFVYAYRLNEIHYGKEITMKPYPKGETHAVCIPAQIDEGTAGMNLESGKVNYSGEQEYQFEIEGIEVSDFNGDDETHQLIGLSSEDGAEEYMVKASGNDWFQKPAS